MSETSISLMGGLRAFAGDPWRTASLPNSGIRGGDLQQPLYVGTGRLLCATSGHSPTAQ